MTDVTLRPVDAAKRLADLPCICWIGSDGGHRGGCLVGILPGGDGVALDRLRGECVLISMGNWRDDPKKDVTGKPIETPAG